MALGFISSLVTPSQLQKLCVLLWYGSCQLLGNPQLCIGLHLRRSYSLHLRESDLKPWKTAPFVICPCKAFLVSSNDDLVWRWRQLRKRSVDGTSSAT